MENYTLLEKLGAGSFGTVRRAIDMRSGEVVAIKKLNEKIYSWEECMNLSEVKALRILTRHRNIVKLREVIRENCDVFFVFEYMDCNLRELMKNEQKPLSEAQVRVLCFQILHGLAYMHHRGFFHRDLKPDNLLVGNGVIKIADFGSAREITSQPPYSSYVTTRWYRAPEVMLRTEAYTSKVDMWAVGAIMAELFTFRPLFPGMNEADQMYKICRVIGSPTMESWPGGLRLASDIHYMFPQLPGVHLAQLIPSASRNAISLISSLCSWDPSKRPTAMEALHHPFFQTCYFVPRTLVPGVAVARTNYGPIGPPRKKEAMKRTYEVSELVEWVVNMAVADDEPSRLKQPNPRDLSLEADYVRTGILN